MEIITRMISLMIKRIFIIFLLFCLTPFCRVYASNCLGFYKYNKNVVISVENLDSEYAVLIMGRYSQENSKFLGTTITEISYQNGKYESGIIRLSDNILYKFFLWNEIGGMIPLDNVIMLSSHSPDGSGNVGDGEYTKPY